jgi:hypothetical protein
VLAEVFARDVEREVRRSPSWSPERIFGEMGVLLGAAVPIRLDAVTGRRA